MDPGGGVVAVVEVVAEDGRGPHLLERDAVVERAALEEPLEDVAILVGDDVLERFALERDGAPALPAGPVIAGELVELDDEDD